MTTYKFSTLANGQHLTTFDSTGDLLDFDSTSVSAGAVRLSFSGSNIGLTYGGKTVWLDTVALGELALGSGANVSFANASVLAVGDGTANLWRDSYGKSYDYSASTVGNQVWGLGGADAVKTGSGADYLVGNTVLSSLNQVSRNSGGGSVTPSSHATVSADGQFVAFAGGWTGYGSLDNSATDVIVKDMASGAFSIENRSAGGVLGNSGNYTPTISADGKVLVFHSASSNLVALPASQASYDIYLSDVLGNAIQRVSTNSAGTLAADGRSENADVSADGGVVAFESTTSNWFAGGSTQTTDVFVKSISGGALTRVSTSLTGTDGNGESRYAKVSADGRYVVFQSDASNLTANDTNGYSDVFLWDRNATGNKLTNLSATLPGTQLSNGAYLPDVANDGAVGGIVVFQTAKSLVAGDTNGGTDIYAYRLATHSVQLVSSKADGSVVSGASEDASVSGDGRFVVFTGYSASLVAGDDNGVADIFVKDLVNGQIALVSRSPSGVVGNASSTHAQISLGGDWIVFESGASNLASTDANAGAPDVFRVSNPLLKDTLEGGAGNDTYVLARADIVTEATGAGTDTVMASISWTLGANFENLTLTGTANLAGTGNSLNNVIAGNAGNNLLNGSTGVDTVTYAGAPAAVTVSLDIATAQTTGFGSDTLSGFENLTGSAFNDQLTGNGEANRLDGGLGSDTLTGGAGADTYVVGAATDIVVESSTVAAEIDTVVSSVAWTLGARLENLTLSGSAVVNGGGNSSANVLTGNTAANTLDGYSGNDTLKGGDGNDSLLGGDGNDSLDGNAGNDTLVGGNGSDTYVTDSAADVITETGTGAADIDTVVTGVSWTLGATLERLTLSGSAALNGGGNSLNNLITGNDGANGLSGGSGNDTMNGGLGNDVLTGSTGNDSLAGGSGNDVFVLNSTAGSDTVSDFLSGTDDIRISMSALRVGDGDLLVEGAATRSSPGGFSASAELVIFTANVASFSTSAAAAAIGSATGAYAIGHTALFALDNGSSSALYLFTAAGADAGVSASELALLATLTGTASTVAGDYVFGT